MIIIPYSILLAFLIFVSNYYEISIKFLVFFFYKKKLLLLLLLL